jgi:hypothetical protein
MKRISTLFLLSLSTTLIALPALAEDAGTGAAPPATEAGAEPDPGIGGDASVEPARGTDAGSGKAHDAGAKDAGKGKGTGGASGVPPHDYALLKNDGGTACTVSHVGTRSSQSTWLLALVGTSVALGRRRGRR